jgi:Fic family protein
MFIHERADWPTFRWSHEELSAPLAAVRHRQGRLLGRMESLDFDLRMEATLQTLTRDVLMTSEIEGEILPPSDVRPSLARRLGIDVGLDAGGLTAPSREVDGIVEVLLDATQNYARPLTADRLFGWHSALFTTGRNGMSPMTVGAWRTDANGPMQVVSGPVGRETVHSEAPAAHHLDREVGQFLDWFNADTEPEADTGPDLVLRSAIAHLWFVTIHPFDDGNGRIGRAIADLFLARSEGTSQRFYSMSAQIRIERSDYYAGLEAAQRGDLDITARLRWFVDCLGRAIDGAEVELERVLATAHFWTAVAGIPLNTRQRNILQRLLGDFEGNLTTTKWAKLTKSSPDTALRDIDDLIARNILRKNDSGGRSTSYSLVIKSPT